MSDRNGLSQVQGNSFRLGHDRKPIPGIGRVEPLRNRQLGTPVTKTPRVQGDAANSFYKITQIAQNASEHNKHPWIHKKWRKLEFQL
ncbi:hypothetical protein, partial [Nocardiopsis eucommiae]|uniref:hypothetical protein n=1 Tax=Nocardiopsis eucommiae TaxID=2831970 RepID=UPI003D75A592